MGGGEKELVTEKHEQDKTASFWKGAKSAQELKNLSSGRTPSGKLRFQIRKALVLSDAEYGRYLNGELFQPKFYLAAEKESLRYDTKLGVWNCLLLVGESSRDGILVGFLPGVELPFLSYVPDHRELELPKGLPVEMEMGAVSTNLDQAVNGVVDAVAHYTSFVGLELRSPASSLHFAAYDPAANILTVLEQGGPNDYMQFKGTPEEIAQTFHFSGKLKKVFFDLRYRNISHGSRFVKEKRERVPSKERNGDGR